MRNLLFIFLGSGFGGMLRYGIQRGTLLLWGPAFPYGTFFINLTGSFLAGLLFIFISTRAHLSVQLTSLLIIGFLGGYTTFSGFSLEIVSLFERGIPLIALAYIFLSVFFGIAFCFWGIYVGKSLFLTH